MEHHSENARPYGTPQIFLINPWVWVNLHIAGAENEISKEGINSGQL